MVAGFAEVLTFGIGVALSPVPAVAVILILLSARARTNGPAFLLGWMIALAALAALVYSIGDASHASSSDEASDRFSWLRIVLGVACVTLAVREWKKRPSAGAELKTPRWLDGIGSLSPSKAFGAGLTMAGVSPKNFMLTLGAAAGLAQLGISTPSVVVSTAFFVAVGSLTVGGLVCYYVFGGDHAEGTLNDLKRWLLANNSAVMAVLFLAFGAVLIVNGLERL